MSTGIYAWSQTAGSNDTADSNINWAEGQSPPTLNNSARAMMSVLARWRDDISGVQPSNVVQTTAGTSTALTLTTNASIAALTNGWTVKFKASVTNTGAVTLAVDGLTAKNIQSIAGTNLVGGEILAGCTYTVTYFQPNDAWVLAGCGATPGLWRISTGSVSVAASQSFVLTNYTGYRALKFVLTGWQPVTDNASLLMRFSTNAGVAYDSGSADYEYTLIKQTSFDGTTLDVANNSADSSVVLAVALGNDSFGGVNIEIDLWNPQSTTIRTQVSWHGSQHKSDDSVRALHGAAMRWTTQDTDAVQFLFDSGNIAAGTYAMYGVL